MSATRAIAWCAACVALGATGCTKDLTQIMVVTDTDIPVDTVDGVLFVVEAGDERHERPPAALSAGSPATLAIVRDDDSIQEIRVTAVGTLGGTPVMPGIERSARVRFVAGEVRVLELQLLHDCLGATCSPGETCVEGGDCASEVVSDLAPWTGTPPTLEDAGPPGVDGGPRDAGPDATRVDSGPCTIIAETTCDGIDGDCDGRIDEDVDSTSTATCGACGFACTGAAACVHGLCESETIAVAAGDAHTCATSASGAVFCWGSNADRRLGDGTDVDQHDPAAVAGLSAAARKIAAGEKFSCALSSGEVYCWGDDGEGQLGDGATSAGPGPTLVDFPLEGNAIDLSAGTAHACAVFDDGVAMTAWCWGRGGNGQLGNGMTMRADSPVLVAGITDVVSIAAGGSHSCAVHGGGATSCWGENSAGQLGIPAGADQRMPVAVEGLTRDVQAVTAGELFTCALVLGGEVLCWGHNLQGQLGHGGTEDGSAARSVADPGDAARRDLTGALQVAAGASHACAVLRDGRVGCWGHNESGELGAGMESPRSLFPLFVRTSPAPDVHLDGIVRVAAGAEHTCAIRRDGTEVFCWGGNRSGQLGDGMTDDRAFAGPTSSF